MKTTQHFLITGIVQGVGFRRFVEKSAQKLGLCGWVRNLNDGRVETMVTGDSVTLEKFGILLNEGPALSQVVRVDCQNLSVSEDFVNFTVMKNGEKPWGSLKIF